MPQCLNAQPERRVEVRPSKTNYHESRKQNQLGGLDLHCRRTHEAKGAVQISFEKVG